jgi:hypothetical protein
MTRENLAKFLRNEYLGGATVFLIVLAVYRTTMCPTVSFTDSGELATVATTLGIAHPTGYPLWTLIARVAVMLPFGTQEIVRLNVFSCLLTSLAVGFLFKLILTVFRSANLFRFRGRKLDRSINRAFAFSAFVTALIVGFSSTLWSQSVEIEVYALHALLIVLVLVLFISGLEDQLADVAGISRRLLLFAFVLGLSFSNHMTTILLAPGFLYLYFVALGFQRRSWTIIGMLIPFFVLGLSVYLYLPIRAASGPLMDWGHPVTLERFWWHVTGKQYQTWMFAGWNVAAKQLNYFITNFPTEFGWPVIAFLLLGVVKIINRSRRLATFLLLLFVSCVVYSINFDIHEIDPYFILAYLVCAVFIASVLIRLSVWSFGKKQAQAGIAVLLVCMSLPVFQVCNNRGDVDQSKNYRVRNFVHDVFAELEPHAVVFSSLWDYFVSPSYYYQVVRKERPDVVIIDRGLLQNRSWYFIQLQRTHPEILGRSEDKVEAFLKELNKFERGEPYNFEVIRGRWDDLLNDLVAQALPEHPVYVDPRIAGDFQRDFTEVPQGLLVRLSKKGKNADWRPISAQFENDGFQNYVVADMRRYFVSMYTYHAYWLATHGLVPRAEENIKKSLDLDPQFVPALNLRSQISGLQR